MTAAQQALADALDAALPQTQCTRCGEPDCRRYAVAIATGRAPINRCPPGGAEGIERLAALTGQAPRTLDPAHGNEGPRRLAVIDEAVCIGCTLCIKACPVDCIVGAAKHMHTVIESQCTGCELCLPACPVDCIALVDAGVQTQDGAAATGWAAWSAAEATAARRRYGAREARRAATAAASLPAATISAAAESPDPNPADRRRAAVAEALRKARLRRSA